MARRGRPRYPDILTPREWEVLDLLREGLSNEQIAGRLGVSLAGAKYHVSEILGKLGVSSRAEAAAWQPEQQPWWASALAPFALVWRRTTASTVSAVVSGALAGALAVFVLAGAGLLVWGLVRTGGGGGDELASAGGAGGPDPLSPPVETGFTPGPELTPPRPVSPPVATHEPEETPSGDEGALHLLNPETGDIQRLSIGGVFSPDGRFLATGSHDGPGVDVFEIATSKRVRVFDMPAMRMTWSPDGTQLAISVYELPGSSSGKTARLEEGVFIANADGSGYRKVAASGATAGTVSWSPRGDWLAITRRNSLTSAAGGEIAGMDYELVLLSHDARERRSVYSEYSRNMGDAFQADAAWSPSGSSLAFFLKRPGQLATLNTIDVDSGATRVLAEGIPNAAELHWSPDGSQLAFGTFDPNDLVDGRPDSSYEVHLVPSDGRSPPRLISNGRWISWSPDGRYLAFIENWCHPEEPKFDLAVHDVTTGATQRITPPDFDLSMAEFSSSDDQIAFLTFGDNALRTVRTDGSGLKLLYTLPDMTDSFGWTPAGDRIFFWAPHGGFGICD